MSTQIIGALRHATPTSAANRSTTANDTHPTTGPAEQSVAMSSPKAIPTDVSAHFDEAMKVLVMTITDSRTGAVMSQIPSEGLQSLVHRTIEFQSKFLNLKV